MLFAATPCVESLDLSPQMSSSNVVAVFDFDGTLTRRDSLLPFLYHIAGPLGFLWNTLALLPTLLRYALGWMPNGEAKAEVFAQFLASRSAKPVEGKAQEYATDRLPSMLREEAMHRLRWHQEQGHRTVLISASASLYLTPWAKTEGFDEVLCTKLEVEDGRFTGQFEGVNCYGPEKARRLRASMPNIGNAEVYVYGDSDGDRELLGLANHPHYRSFEQAVPYPEDNDATLPFERKNSIDTENDPFSWRRLRIILLVAGGSIALYGGVAVWGGASEIWSALQTLSPSLLLGLLSIVLAGYLVRFARWHWYLRCLGYDVPWRDNLRIFFSSFALTATPGKAGESVKSLFLKRSQDVPVAPTLGALFAERFTDLLSVVLVVGVGLATLAQGQWIVVTVGAVQLGTVALLLKPRWVRRAVFLPLARRESLRQWVRPIDSLFDGARQLLQPQRLGGGLLLGGLPWLGEGVAMWFLFQAMGAEAVALHEAVWIHAAATLFGAVTFLPGGVGGHEAASISLSIAYGASRPDAVAATVLIRVLTLWFAVGLGLLVAATSMGRMRPAGE